MKVFGCIPDSKVKTKIKIKIQSGKSEIGLRKDQMDALYTVHTTLDKKRVEEITCIQRVRKVDALQYMEVD